MEELLTKLRRYLIVSTVLWTGAAYVLDRVAHHLVRP